MPVARALGDYDYKKAPGTPPEKNPVSCEPEIMFHTRTREDGLLLLACDGIWDVLDNQKAVDCLETAVKKTGGLNGAAVEIVLDTCLRLESTDNMSLVALDLSQTS